MKIILLALITLFVLYDALSGYFTAKKKLRTELTEKARIKMYAETIVSQWALLLVFFVLSMFDGITAHDVGLRAVRLAPPIWLSITGCVLAGAFSLVCIYQVIMCIISPAFQAKVKEQLDKSAPPVDKPQNAREHYDSVVTKLMLPHTKKEKATYTFLSLTAGICEEILFRGYTLYLLCALIPGMTFFLAAVLSCFLFGIVHSYQGLKGMIKTSAIGALFVLLYYLTGSLFPGIVVHFLCDFSSTFLLHQEDLASSPSAEAESECSAVSGECANAND